MNVVLPFLSTILSLAFAGAVLSQFAARRKPYQLVWGIGLIWFAIASAARLLVGVGVWNNAVYQVWYLFGGILVAAYLGMGTIYLLASRRFAHVVMALLALASLAAAFLLFTAPVDLAALPVGTLKGDALPQYIRLMTPLFNVFGSVALVLGAAYSAYVLWRKRIMPERVVSNILIAVGGFLPATGGTFLRFGIPDISYVTEFLGVALIFAGFLVNYEVIASRFAWRARPAAGRRLEKA